MGDREVRARVTGQSAIDFPTDEREGMVDNTGHGLRHQGRDWAHGGKRGAEGKRSLHHIRSVCCYGELPCSDK